MQTILGSLDIIQKNTIDVQSLNAAFKKYPVTMQDKGWTYGVWYCGTSFTRAEMYGQHPPTYLKRLVALFPHSQDWLICPSGIIKGGAQFGKQFTCVDLVSRKEGCPDVIASAAKLPFANESFDVVESDPPYGDEHCKIYGVPKYPRKKAMAEFYRVLRSGGYLCWLDVRYPSYKRQDWKLIGLICVITGFERVARVCSIFQKINKSVENVK